MRRGKQSLREFSSKLIAFPSLSFSLSLFLLVFPAKLVMLYNQMRGFWYMMWAAVDDEETQRKGLIYVFYNIFPSYRLSIDLTFQERFLVWRSARYVQAFPVRIKCLHFCSSQNNLRPLFGLAMLGAGKEIRPRFRFHNGTELRFTFQDSQLPILIS